MDGRRCIDIWIDTLEFNQNNQNSHNLESTATVPTYLSDHVGFDILFFVYPYLTSGSRASPPNPSKAESQDDHKREGTKYSSSIHPGIGLSSAQSYTTGQFVTGFRGERKHIEKNPRYSFFPDRSWLP